MPLFFFFFALVTVVCVCLCLCACIISAVLISGRLSSSKLRASYCTSTALIHKQNTDTFHYLLTKKKKKKKKRKRKVVGQRQPTKTVLHTEKKKAMKKKSCGVPAQRVLLPSQTGPRAFRLHALLRVLHRFPQRNKSILGE